MSEATFEPLSSTRRKTSAALEQILYKKFDVLDHGYVAVMDYMGTDSSIVQAARVSYGEGTKHIQEDAGLVRYLLRNMHTSPFEMCEIKLLVRLPIFVARQWIRHRTANVNEYSARYSTVKDKYYIPRVEHMGAQSTSNRQGQGNILPVLEAADARERFGMISKKAYDDYEYFLNDAGEGKPINPHRGMLARELARMVLPVNFYTEWYWKIDLHNLFHFLRLRADNHAQYEIRAYADLIIEKIVKPWVPLACAAFMDYRMGATSLSARDVDIIQAIQAGQPVGPVAEKFGWMSRGLNGALRSNRERDECTAKLLKLGFNINWDEQ